MPAHLDSGASLSCESAPWSEVMLATPCKRAKRTPLPDATPAPPLKLAPFAGAIPAAGCAPASAAADATQSDREAADAACSPRGAGRKLFPRSTATPVAAKQMQPEEAAANPSLSPGAPLATPPPPPAGAAAGCFMLPRKPTARRLFDDEEPVQAQQAQKATNDFLAELEKQGRDRFAERWGFDVKLGQPLPNHSRYQWEAVTCT
ncbi:expressed protein [Chlorella variabilis]|uniref:Expressed protein n=1 Tax=Chlorella variabilis TaxID=554065 RepID=E1Z491_CHLVA|nr:expressed protein [Chlorella variabilis]EFN59311.1 expressed protein [Chlorella variabilis]|eukprot:XP_005851413.1 expressed protein [Chlorella variabilis]